LGGLFYFLKPTYIGRFFAFIIGIIFVWGLGFIFVSFVSNSFHSFKNSVEEIVVDMMVNLACSIHEYLQCPLEISSIIDVFK
jgi:hypothetical protein